MAPLIGIRDAGVIVLNFFAVAAPSYCLVYAPRGRHLSRDRLLTSRGCTIPSRTGSIGIIIIFGAVFVGSVCMCAGWRYGVAIEFAPADWCYWERV